MTIEKGAKLKILIQEFFNEEMGNRLTKWNSNAFAQTIAYEIDNIIELHKEKEKNKED